MGAAVVGRDVELARLRARLDEARGGRARAVVVSGPPGAGKTTLCDRFCEDLDDDVRVAWARSWELGGAPPYWPFAELLRGVDHAWDDPRLGAILPELGAPAREPTPFDLFDAVRRGITAASQARPLLLVLEDVHATDPSSQRLASFLFASLRDARVLFVATRRDTEARVADPAALADALRHAEELALPPLACEAVPELLASLGAAGDAELVRELHRRTGGNPLFLTSLVSAALADGTVDALRRGGGRLPEGVRSVLEAQIARLSEATVGILRVAALLRRRVSVESLARACGRSRAELDGRLAEAAHARVIGVVEDEVRFAHDLFADVLESAIPPPERAAMHAQIADAIEREGGSLTEIARHALAAGEDDATRRAIAAAEEALRSSAYDTAVGLFERAAAATTTTEQELAARIGLGHALRRAGRADDARECFRDVSRRAGSGRPRELAQAALGESRALEFGLPNAEVIARLDEAGAALGDADHELAVELRSELAHRLWGARGQDERRAELARWLARSSVEGLSPPGRLRRSVGRFYSHWGPDGVEERREIVREMQALLAQLDVADRLEVHRYSLNLAWERCDGLGARAALSAYRAAAEELDSLPVLGSLHLREAAAAQHVGDFDEAARLVDAISAIGDRMGNPLRAFFDATGRALGWLERGEGDALVPHLPMIEDAVRRNWPNTPGVAATAFGMRALLGRADEVREEYERILAGGPSLPDVWSVCHLYGYLAEAAILLEDAAGARTVLERALPYAALNMQCGMCLPLGPLARPLGKLALALDELDRAEALTRQACELSERLGATYPLAHARAQLSEILDRRGKSPAEARGLERAAAEAARSGGWPSLLARIEGTARSAPTAPAPTRRAARRAHLERRGDVWTIGFDGSEVQLRHSTGLGHIAALVARPHTPIHALELMGAHEGASRGADEVVDGRAIAAYKERAEALRDELREAEDYHDLGRAERARAELEALADQLLSVGALGGRTRRGKSDAERARSAVTQAVRRATAKIREHHPELAHHLGNGIKTGTLCVYDPEPGARVEWVESDRAR